MTTPVQNAIKAALAVTASVAGETATYRRGATSVQLHVTLGSSQFDQESAGEVFNQFETVDVILDSVATAALIAATGLPAIGDTITTATRVHTVTSNLGEKPYRYMDHFRTVLRIHTTYTGAAA